jgi:hypothetical protein
MGTDLPREVWNFLEPIKEYILVKLNWFTILIGYTLFFYIARSGDNFTLPLHFRYPIFDTDKYR